MFMNLLVALMPIATRVVDAYIASSETKKDDEVLELVKKGAKYLAEQPTNTLTQKDAMRLDTRKMEV